MQKGSEENLAGNASEIVGNSAILSNSVVLSDWTKLTIDFTNIFCNNWQRLNSRNGLWVVYNRRVKHNRPGFLIKDFLKHVENKSEFRIYWFQMNDGPKTISQLT